MTQFRPNHPFTKALFALTIFASAFLLFQVQPIMAKFILPWFGGTPSVWTTCMLFFQVLLLGGYCYAHALMRLRPKMQLLLHGILTLAALELHSLSPDPNSIPTGEESPVPYILLLLAGTVGLPYFLLSTTGPLVQAWYARVFPGASPYRLYSLSNIGSLGALLSYPILFEPLLAVEGQSRLWSFGFWIFALLIILTAGISHKAAPVRELHDAAERAPASLIAIWFTLAASASTLLLAITNHVCQDVAVIPFLWVLPLSLYLLSFILCFESARWYRRKWYVPLLAVLMLLLCDPQFTGPQANVLVALFVSFSTLFVACMVCHGELVAIKPRSSNLTGFYVVLSAGGAFGGIFVAIIAPALFSSFIELHLSLFAIVLCVVLVLFRDQGSFLHAGPRTQKNRMLVLGGLLLIGGALWQNASRMATGALLQTRNFYGVLRLTEEQPDDPERHRFVQYHGRILHGFQYTAPNRRNQPNAYFGSDTGVGLTLRHFPREQKRIGVVGLGVGTLAAYGQPGDVIRFYEINPDVIDQTTRYFSFVQDSAAETSIILGDGRLSLDREQNQSFDILVLDAFSGDAVPAHLLTKEAFLTYSRHLAPDGVIAVNITNSHLDLRPVLRGAAASISMQSAWVRSERDEARGLKNCDWMLLSPNPAFFELPEIRSRLEARGGQDNKELLWTDAHNNLFSILKRS